MVPLDTSWFDRKPEKYLAREDFIHFETVSGIKLRDLLSPDKNVVRRVQHEFVAQSIIANEIQKQYFSFAFPFIVYTHLFDCFENVSNWNEAFEKLILESDMGDSLRRRHLALSYGILPHLIEEMSAEGDRSLTIKNLGSGVGLDVIRASMKRDGRIGQVLNFDTNEQALKIGRKIVRYLEKKGDLKPDTVHFVNRSLTSSPEPADIIVMVGVICGLQDFAAQLLIANAYNQLNPGGKLVVSSSNENMESIDPLVSFLIQHLGTREDPLMGWGLNFRKKETLEKMLREAGYSEIAIYSDTEYPGRDALPEEILHGIDTLPAEAMGYEHSGKPLNLPPREVLDQRTSYNWIAVAAKG